MSADLPGSLGSILDGLERCAAYAGPWTPLREEAALLGRRVEELRDREMRLDDLLVVALVGGSGVGKSTLLNALAGDELAKTSEFRPCTSTPTVYHPPGARLPFGEDWRLVSGSALEHLVIIDTPDSDTIVREHRERVIEALHVSDLIMMCADAEKYLDEATWSLLRPLQGERTLVCIETKATANADSVKAHWLQRLSAEGFEPDAYFRVNALHTFDRKLTGKAPGPDEFDFPKLERFLQDELTQDRIQRIKRSNAAGLLSKTVATLRTRLLPRRPSLEALEQRVTAANADLEKEGFEVVKARLFTEPHLWAYAFGREMSLRSKGIVGTLYRVVELVRTLPARVAAWTPWPGRGGAGTRAARLLNSTELFNEDLDFVSHNLERIYEVKASELRLEFTRSGFEPIENRDSYLMFVQTLSAAVSEILRGPAREQIVRRARVLTSWPVAIALDIAPLCFFVFAAWRIVATYFTGGLFGPAELSHATAVLAILLVGELLVLALAGRAAAWSARRAAARELRARMAGVQLGFEEERTCLADTLDRLGEIEGLITGLPGSDTDEERRPARKISEPIEAKSVRAAASS